MLYGPNNQLLPSRREFAPGYGRASMMESVGMEYHNPDDTARTRGLEYYDDIARDPHVRSVWNTRVMAVVGCERTIQPASGHSRDQAAADLLTWNLDEYLQQRSLDVIVAQLVRSATKNGYTVQELMWNPTHPRGVVLHDLRDRDPERFILKPGGIYLKPYAHAYDGVLQPRHKFIAAAFDAEYENPYGASLFQSIHWYVWFKKNGYKFWLVFLEKFGMPTVLCETPDGFAEPGELERVDDVLDSIQARTSIRVPSGFQISLLEATRAGSSSGGYDLLCNQCDQQISKAILGQTLTVQEGQSSGSYALGRVHEAVRNDILIADGKWLDSVINWQLIPRLIDYNYAVERYPYLVTQTHPDANLQAEIAIDEKLVQMGVRLPQAYFYEKYNRPEPRPGDACVGDDATPDNDSPVVERSVKAGL